MRSSSWPLESREPVVFLIVKPQGACCLPPPTHPIIIVGGQRLETQIVFDVSKQNSTAEELTQNPRTWGRFVDVGFPEDAQYGSGETAQWLRALITLREDQSSVLSTHIRWLTVAYNSNSRVSNTLSWPL